MLAILAIIITLLLVIGVHELGHALAAYFFSVKIKRIAIGFGKPLMCYKGKSGCEWVWGRWPLGGYATLLSTRTAPVNRDEIPDCFDKKPIWVRAMILCAGSIANFCCAIACLTVFYILGFQQVLPVINSIKAHSIAAKAGFEAHDIILAINQKKVVSWQEVNMRTIENLGEKQMTVMVQRRHTHKQLYLGMKNIVHPNVSLWEGLGLKPEALFKQDVPGVPFLQALRQGWGAFLSAISFNVVLIKQLVLGHIPLGFLLGPIGVIEVAFVSFTQGVSQFCFFIAWFSAAMGLVNSFPFPGLDGASLAYLVFEKIYGHPLSVAFELLLYNLAQIACGVFIVQLLLNDIRSILV